MFRNTKLARIIASSVFTAIFVFSATGVFAQESPLTLGEISTALESTSSGMTIVELNTFVIQRVNQRGVAFSLTPEITDQLKTSGASTTLVAAIRSNAPASNQTSTTKSTKSTPNINFGRLWVEQDILRDGRMGIVVHTEYTAYNVKDRQLQLTVRFLDSSDETLRTSNQNFSNKNGELALFKNFQPGHDAAVYPDWNVFVPYDEFPLPAGTHNLKIKADVIYADGKPVGSMDLFGVTLTKPQPSKTAPNAEFSKMWVDYGITQGGRIGMVVHVKLKTYNLKDTTCYVTINFEKQSGERLITSSTLYADRRGGVTLSKELRPGHPTSIFNDLAAFIPYEELNLQSGDHDLKMRVDLVYPDGGLIKHLSYYDFRFSKP